MPSSGLSYHTFTILRDTDDAFQNAAYESYVANDVQYSPRNEDLVRAEHIRNGAYQLPLDDNHFTATYFGTGGDIMNTINSTLGDTDSAVHGSHTNIGFPCTGHTLRDTDEAMQNTAYQAYFNHNYAYDGPVGSIMNTVGDAI